MWKDSGKRVERHWNQPVNVDLTTRLIQWTGDGGEASLVSTMFTGVCLIRLLKSRDEEEIQRDASRSQTRYLEADQIDYCTLCTSFSVRCFSASISRIVFSIILVRCRMAAITLSAANT